MRDVAEALGLNLATTYHLVNTLVHEGYVARSPERGLVAGPRLAARTAPGLAPAPVRRALGKAAYAVGDVAVLCSVRHGEAFVTAAEEVPGAPCGGRYLVGSRHLPHLSAAGRVILAADRSGAGLRDAQRAAGASGMPFERAVLEEELERVRRRGSAVVEAETEACVGAPVLDARGAVVGAVALVVTPRVLRRNEPELVATVRHAAASVSRSLASDPAAAA